MAWVEQRPHAIVTLEESMSLYQTQASRNLAEGYLGHLSDNGSGIPGKQALDISRFAKAVPHLVLCAVTLPDKCIWRLVGESVKERHGFNATGCNYYDFVPVERRGNAINAMNMVVSVPCGFRAEIMQTHTDGRQQLVEAVGFPFESNEPSVDGFILFTDQGVKEASITLEEQGTWLGTNVIRRDLIDLGFGVDETFEDLVWIEE